MLILPRFVIKYIAKVSLLVIHVCQISKDLLIFMVNIINLPSLYKLAADMNHLHSNKTFFYYFVYSAVQVLNFYS